MGQRQTFRQSDVARAVKGVTAAGLTPSMAEVLPDGRIVVHIGLQTPEPQNPFDRWKSKRDARQTQGD